MERAYKELAALFEAGEDCFPTQDWRRINDGVLLYRTREIRSGDMLEIQCYPVMTRAHQARATRVKPTPAAMERINREERKRRLIRKAQCNFTHKALFVTLTYSQDPEEEQAARDLSNYLRRVKYQTGKKHRGNGVKYIAVTEVGHNGRIHHHLLIEGAERELVEGAWKNGFSNCRRYQENKEGFAGLVRYMLKKNSTLEEPDGEAVIKRRIRCSTGLKEPIVKIRDNKISIRRLGIIADEAEQGGQETLEKIYKGYECQRRPIVKTNIWLPGAYVYAAMWRKRE